MGLRQAIDAADCRQPGMLEPTSYRKAYPTPLPCARLVGQVVPTATQSAQAFGCRWLLGVCTVICRLPVCSLPATRIKKVRVVSGSHCRNVALPLSKAISAARCRRVRHNGITRRSPAKPHLSFGCFDPDLASRPLAVFFMGLPGRQGFCGDIAKVVVFCGVQEVELWLSALALT